MVRSLPPALRNFLKAAKEEGFMKKGEFKKLPKKGSASYKKIKTRADAMPGGSSLKARKKPVCKKGKKCGKACIKKKAKSGKRTVCTKKRKTKTKSKKKSSSK